MTEDEIGELFPIKVVSYDCEWPKLFDKEKEKIFDKIGKKIVLRTEHFGSTAIKGLKSKPTIDILIEIPKLTSELKKEIVDKMEQMNYHFIWRTDNEIPYMMFAKGYTKKGFSGQTYHIHMADKNHSLWDRLYFRDYLKEHPEIAKEYEHLKLDLAEKHEHNRENYTRAKTEFITRITEIAKKASTQ